MQSDYSEYDTIRISHLQALWNEDSLKQDKSNWDPDY